MDIEVVKCKNGKAFMASHTDSVDLEIRIEQLYYTAQGCTVETVKTFDFEKCGCDHCKTLKHEFHEFWEKMESEGLIPN
jgi:hypothetical protein